MGVMMKWMLNRKCMNYVATICLCVATPALAEIYKWVDENGVTHYSSKVPTDQNKKQPPLPVHISATVPEAPSINTPPTIVRGSLQK
ncbi:MAG: DUF4124 domain-containing protein [Gammaproteobacteria bacterium]|nr:DUF4124 domain-containing protein [Gammaproteobacteria bacterium]